jgi:hypothetical protein
MFKATFFLRSVIESGFGDKAQMDFSILSIIEIAVFLSIFLGVL